MKMKYFTFFRKFKRCPKNQLLKGFFYQIKYNFTFFKKLHDIIVIKHCKQKTF